MPSSTPSFSDKFSRIAIQPPKSIAPMIRRRDFISGTVGAIEVVHFVLVVLRPNNNTSEYSERFSYTIVIAKKILYFTRIRFIPRINSRCEIYIIRYEYVLGLYRCEYSGIYFLLKY